VSLEQLAVKYPKAILAELDTAFLAARSLPNGWHRAQDVLLMGSCNYTSLVNDSRQDSLSGQQAPSVRMFSKTVCYGIVSCPPCCVALHECHTEVA
jgi:hypothetical protein